MKSKNRLSKAIAFLVLLTVIAMIFVANTYSKYATNASGSDSVVVAKWSFLVNDEEIAVKGDAKTIDFNLFDTIYDSDGEDEEDVADGVIAPGTSGSFEFALQNTSEVTAQYAIKLDVDNTKIPLEFSFDGEEWKNNLTNLMVQDVLEIGASKNVKVMWRWAFGIDTATDISLSEQEVNVSANITATQFGDGDYVVYTEKQVFPGVVETVNSFGFENLHSTQLSIAPYAYQNKALFSGKTITKIGIPVSTVQAIDNEQTFTLHIVDKTTVSQDRKATIRRTETLVLPEEQLLGCDPTAVNKYIYIDLTPYNITLAEDETLGFQSTTDTVTMTFIYNVQDYYIGDDYKILTRLTSDITNLDNYSNFYLDIYYLEEEKPEQSETLSSILAGKNFSILGDSISTYTGYSNDATNTNNTIGNNEVYYNGSKGDITSVNQTWWKQAIDETGMNLLVNNSWSGSQVLNNLGSSDNNAGYLRATNLHDNTGDNSGTNPDIVALWMGVNDLYAGTELGTYSEDLYDTLITENGGSYTYATPTNLTEAYIITVHKIITTYEDVNLFCFTLLPTDWAPHESIEPFNNVIRNVATHYNVEIVDLYNDSGITWENYEDYYFASARVHPNQLGMDLVTQTFIKALENKYLNN